MTNPIIVGVALREDDSAPIALGRDLARLTGAPLALVHCYPYEPVAAVPTELYERGIRERAIAALERLAAPLRPEIEVVVRAGIGPSPADALHDAAHALDAGLVVAGSTHRGPVGRVMPGSVTARLLHGAPCAVAVAPRGYAGGREIRRIGVAYIDTPEGRDALAAGALIAGLCRATVRAFTVHRPVHSGSALAVPGWVNPTAAEDHDVERWAASAERARGLLPADALEDVEVIFGRPAHALIARSSDLDLLVCGSRGHGPVRAVMLGDVSRAIVDGAACPVLVLPRAAGERIERLVRRRAAVEG
jgi:nucleotide-binding universal stress UspA family protein